MLGNGKAMLWQGRLRDMHVVLIIAACLLLIGLVGGNDTDHDWWD